MLRLEARRGPHDKALIELVGQLDHHFEAMELPSEPGLTLKLYTAAYGTPTSDALTLLASWVAGRPRAGVERSLAD